MLNTEMIRRAFWGVATATVLTFLGTQAQATEAAAGRYIPGAFAGPGAGIVPPIPGGYWAVSNIYYHGEASGDVPFGDGSIALGLKADLWITGLAGVYVPEIDLPGNWTYAVQGLLPVGWTRAKAEVGSLEVIQEVGGIGDIAFAPIVLGWHSDSMETWLSTSLTITAPTGVWTEGDIAFVGLNYWTFTPSVAFTRLVPEHGLDFSGNFGVDFNARNPDTDYYSGALAHLDLSATKNVTEHFSLGILAGFLYQIQDDDSTFANNRDDGFKGRSVAIGPLATYKAKFGEGNEINMTLKWAHEIEVENRMKGNAVFFNLAGKF